MTDGSTMQTSFHCDIADKKAYQCTECAADYVGSPVGGGLLPLAPVSHNPRVDVVSSTLTTLPPTINVIKKKCGDRSHTRQRNKQNSYSKQADTQVPQSNGTNNKQLRQEEDAHGSAATHFFHASPNQNNNCNSFNPPCPPLHLFLRLPTRYREGERRGKVLDPTIRPHAVLTSNAPRLLLVEVSDGLFLAWHILTTPVLSAFNWTFSSIVARTPR